MSETDKPAETELPLQPVEHTAAGQAAHAQADRELAEHDAAEAAAHAQGQQHAEPGDPAALATAQAEAFKLAEAATAEAEAARPAMVEMRALRLFANPLTNSARSGGTAIPGDTITVEPFYAQDIQLAGLAEPVDPEAMAKMLERAGQRAPVHGGGITISRGKTL